MNRTILLHTVRSGEVRLEMRGQTLLLTAGNRQKELCRECYPSFDAAVGADDTVFAVYATPTAACLARICGEEVDIAPLPQIREARNFRFLLRGAVPLLFYTVTKNTHTLLHLSFLAGGGKTLFIDACENRDCPFAICTDAETGDIFVTYIAAYGNLTTRRFAWSTKSLGEALRSEQTFGGIGYPDCLFDGGVHTACTVRDKKGRQIAYCPPNGTPFVIYRPCGATVRPILRKEADGLKVMFLQDGVVYRVAPQNLAVEKQEVSPHSEAVKIKYPPNRPDGCGTEETVFIGERTETAPPANMPPRNETRGIDMRREMLEFAGMRAEKPENAELEKLKIRMRFLENKLAELEKRSEKGKEA